MNNLVVNSCTISFISDYHIVIWVEAYFKSLVAMFFLPYECRLVMRDGKKCPLNFGVILYFFHLVNDP